MGTILDVIAGHARERVAADRERLPLEELKELCRERPAFGRAFLEGLKRPGMGFLCEVKRASPSKGVISKEFPYLSRTEGVIPAIESAHALAYAMKLAPSMGRERIIVVNISGRGDKDVAAIARYRGEELYE